MIRMTEREMFEKSFERPSNYFSLSGREQWEIDKKLNILDWSGEGLSEQDEKRFGAHYGGDHYQCISCRRWFDVHPKTVGMISNYGIHCKKCSKELANFEIYVWKSFIKEHGELPDDKYLAEVNKSLWTSRMCLNSNQEKKGGEYYANHI